MATFRELPLCGRRRASSLERIRGGGSLVNDFERYGLTAADLPEGLRRSFEAGKWSADPDDANYNSVIARFIDDPFVPEAATKRGLSGRPEDLDPLQGCPDRRIDSVREWESVDEEYWEAPRAEVAVTALNSESTNEETTMTVTRRRFLAGASASAAALAAPAIIGRAQAADTIKFVSILDQSGGLDIYGKPMVDTTRMAIDEMNAAGGLLGKQIELKVYDPQSTIQFYTQYATQAAAGDKADVAHAGSPPPSREAIRPTFARFRTLYFYNVLYEGGVCDLNNFCTGSTPGPDGREARPVHG